jgi:hypothetical protein
MSSRDCATLCETLGSDSQHKTYPQSVPVLSVTDHVTHTVDDIQNTKASLQGIDGLVKVPSGLLRL